MPPQKGALKSSQGTRAKRACGLPARNARISGEKYEPKSALALLVRVLQFALGDLFEGHGEVVLAPRLDQRWRKVVERALTELVVVVVDLPRALGGDDHERVARVHVFGQLVDAGMDHRGVMVAAPSNSRSTITASLSAARSRSSFSTTWSNSPASSSCRLARPIRSSITPLDSVARSRSRRSSSSTGAVTKIVTAPGTVSFTARAPSVSSSSSGARPSCRIRSISE